MFTITRQPSILALDGNCRVDEWHRMYDERKWIITTIWNREMVLVPPHFLLQNGRWCAIRYFHGLFVVFMAFFFLRYKSNFLQNFIIIWSGSVIKYSKCQWIQMKVQEFWVITISDNIKLLFLSLLQKNKMRPSHFNSWKGMNMNNRLWWKKWTLENWREFRKNGK